jgi:hypothetical protein
MQMIHKRHTPGIKHYFIIISFLLFTFHYSLFTVSAQDTIKLSIPSMFACDGDTLHIPVYAQNFNNVGSIGIKLKYDVSGLVPKGLQNVNQSLSGYLYNETAGQCIFGWAAMNTPANIGNDKLFDLVYTYKGGTSSVSFLPGCEIINMQTYKPFKIVSVNGLIDDTTGYSVHGKVIYDNSFSSPLKNVKLVLYNYEGQSIDSTFSDNSGMYSFSRLYCGNYTIKASSNKNQGGVNPVDALQILRYFVGLYAFSDPLKKKIADVSNDGRINPVDALMINRKFVKLINTFPAGNWYFNKASFNIKKDISYDILGICYGDIDGSFIPSR